MNIRTPILDLLRSNTLSFWLAFTLPLLVLFSFWFLDYTQLSLFLSTSVIFMSGVSAILIALFLKRSDTLESAFVALCIGLVTIVVFPFVTSLSDGISFTEITGLSYEQGTIIWILALGCFLLYGYVYKKNGGSFKALLFLLLTLFLCTWLLSHLNTGDYQQFRPTHNASLQMMLSTYSNDYTHFFSGVGPNRFETAWVSFRPNSVIESDLWNTKVTQATSLVLTLLVTHGALYVFFLFTSLALLIARVSQVCIQKGEEELCSFGSCSAYLIAAFALLALSVLWNPPIWILAVLCTILGSGVAYSSVTGTLDSSKTTKIVQIVLAILFVLIGLTLCVLSAVRITTLHFYDRGVSAIEMGDFNEGVAQLRRALEVEMIPEIARELVVVYKNEATRTIVNSNAVTLSGGQKGNLENILNEAFILAEETKNAEPQHYLNWLLSGDIRMLQWALNSNPALLESAVSDYRNAQKKSANRNPLPLFLEAQALIMQNNITEALFAISNTLRLKHNYQEVWSLSGVYLKAQLLK